MKIRKAVITAAGRSQRALPLQTVVDRDGGEKSVLCILVEQALAARVDSVCVVVWPGDEERYSQSIGSHGGRIRFVPQSQPLGYGHAVLCAREFVAGEPFLHLVGDHLYVTPEHQGCAAQLVDVAEQEGCAVSAVQATRESLLPVYGAVGGRRVTGRDRTYRIETVLEKPTPTEAEQRLTVTGIRAGHYLCFFGMHVLTPTVLDILGRHHAAQPGTPITLSAALAELARQEQYLALEVRGRRFDIGSRYGLLIAQLALALGGRERADILARVLDLVADSEVAAAGAGGVR